MKLRPTQREKLRYLVYEVLADKPVTFAQAAQSIEASATQFAGEQGLAKMNLAQLPKLWDSSKQRGMLRVSRASADTIRAALCLITRAGSQDAMVRSVGVSGILKKAQSQYL